MIETFSALEPSRSAEANGVRRIFFALAIAGAGSTVIAHISQLAGLSFTTYSAASALWVGIAVVAGFVLFRGGGEREGPAAGAVLLSLAALGALLVLFIHKPNPDDYYYLPNVVYYLAHPEQPMGFVAHFIAGIDGPFEVPWLDPSSPYDYLRGAAAHVTGLPVFSVYYLIVPAFVGGLIPLAIYYLTSRFSTSSLDAALGTAVAVGALTLLGEEHRTFGNFAFGRAYQGKVLFMAVLVPVFAGASIDYLRTGRLRYWILLFTLAIAGLGATLTAIVLQGFLAFILALVYLIEDPSRAGLRRVVLYFAALSYVALYAVGVLLFSIHEMDLESPLIYDWPSTFRGHLAFFVKRSAPATAVLVPVASLAALLVADVGTRRVLGLWIGLLLLFFWNPIVAPFLIEHVTTRHIYWRILYVYPFPLVVSIATMFILKRVASRYGSRTRWGFAAGFIILVTVLHLVPGTTSAVTPNLRFATPAPKLRLEYLDAARVIANEAPSGAMLAPQPLAGIVPLVTSGLPQLVTNGYEVHRWFTIAGLPQRAKWRISAARFIAGGTGGSAFPKVLCVDSPRSVVVTVKGALRAEPILSLAGYRRHISHSRYHLFVRDDTATETTLCLDESDVGRSR